MIAMANYCSKCLKKIPQGDHFCSDCNNKLISKIKADKEAEEKKKKSRTIKVYVLR